MKLRLNLATAPPQQKRPFLVGAAISGAVGALLLLVLGTAAYSSWNANRETRGEMSRLQENIRADRQKQQELQSYFNSPSAHQILDRSGFLNSLIDGRSFPWTRIFMDLEKTLPPSVRVVSISPKLDNGRAEVTLEIGAQNDDSKIAFLKAIEASKSFSGMVVKDETHHEEAGSVDRISVSLTVWYTTI